MTYVKIKVPGINYNKLNLRIIDNLLNKIHLQHIHYTPPTVPNVLPILPFAHFQLKLIRING